VAATLKGAPPTHRLDPRRIDAALAAALGLLAQAEVWLTSAGDGQRVETSLAAAAMCAALAWRRSAPLMATLTVVAAVGVLGTVEELPTAIFLLPVTLVAPTRSPPTTRTSARLLGSPPRWSCSASRQRGTPTPPSPI
jgi:hypothetical protein